MKPSEVPIPPKMRLRPLDKRGYPIPWIVSKDLDGVPYFTVNDTERGFMAIDRGICGICGNKLERDRWLVGGPGAAFHEHGAFLDPPMHHQCATYALTVCPFLATRYTKRIDDALAMNGRWPPGMKIVQEDNMVPQQPSFFALVKTASIQRHQEQPGIYYVIPKRPFLAVELWKDGKQITAEEAARLHDEDQDKTFLLEDLMWWDQ